ncbi:hypothetical protein P691DRAFT_799521 [Macrolepiota fuliginosa MF-IS2]|uniref:Reverse transcriptase/retrotransposon-derived protein RNase H-like domain-containing protein n=1 Tax=Macrolepiota fuliginosa MF-IS2 TaxID=1400762 RepID=A0A9P5WYK2_9AGAR|nr:hypothetical protein P691DRAFT_799521 [Macrolepiota fuliginosa MF-IS2]
MGILHELTGNTVPFHWEYTHQHAFQEVKDLAVACGDHHHKPLDYSTNAPPINIITDGCLMGITGVVNQGVDWKTGLMATFYSVKLHSAQQNYPVHEVELLVGIETMLRHWTHPLAEATQFVWETSQVD